MTRPSKTMAADMHTVTVPAMSMQALCALASARRGLCRAMRASASTVIKDDVMHPHMPQKQDTAAPRRSGADGSPRPSWASGSSV
eukprot:scaffold40413_cov38-Tisochrysis_lutea.AAC.2